LADLDPQGQPSNLYFNTARRTERDLSELLGIAKGFLADGLVTEGEARFLLAWKLGHAYVSACRLAAAKSVHRWRCRSQIHARFSHAARFAGRS
jgi:hypothetical protein